MSKPNTPEQKARRKATTRRWYEKLKSDPERYLARAEKQEAYERKHKRHLRAMRRKRDKQRHKAIMSDPVAHEAWLARRRERYHQRMQDPAYREKLRQIAEVNNAKKRTELAASPEARAEYNAAARSRQRARRDFLKATPEGRDILRQQSRRARQKDLADPERRERRKQYAREYARKRRQTEAYRAKKEAERKRREKALRKKRRMAAYRQRPEVKERNRIAKQRWAAQHPERMNVLLERYNLRIDMRCRTDADFYAKVREKRRKIREKQCIAAGKTYKPRIACRIPDHCVKGKVLDRTSPFLRNNLSPDQLRSADAFAREKRIEEREWRDANNT